MKKKNKNAILDALMQMLQPQAPAYQAPNLSPEQYAVRKAASYGDIGTIQSIYGFMPRIPMLDEDMYPYLAPEFRRFEPAEYWPNMFRPHR